MKLKQKPEDFVVTESWRFDEVPRGEYRIYAMDKQKLSTFDAIGRIAETFGLKRNVFSFCGLKDKQGRTRQLIAVRGVDVDLQDEDLRLKYLGRTDKPLSAENTTSNRFGVTVRGLTAADVAKLPGALAEVNRLGVINYFDSQRFGSLKHGQGFIAKDLIRGDFEIALKNYLAKPSDLDRTYDAKVKAFWRDHWGEWRRRCTIPGAQRYEKIIEVLRRDPKDFRGAFLRVDPKYRALLIFTYQSYLWNEGVRRLLMGLMPGQSLLALNYQAGKLLFPQDADAELIQRLRKQSFPLLAPDTKIEDPDVKKAVDWVLGREKLSVEQLQVPNTPEVFFKHEERPIVVYPGRLMIGPPRPDELNDGFSKVYVAFTLPPGSYATLVVRRLFHFTQQDNAVDEELQGELTPAAAAVEAGPNAGRDRPPRRGRAEGADREERNVERRPVRRAAADGNERRPAARPARRGAEVEQRRAPARAAPEPAPEAASGAAVDEAPLGFRARQKLKREKKAVARAAAGARKPAKPAKSARKSKTR